MKTIEIRQSELNLIRFPGHFPSLGWNDRKRIASAALSAAGRRNEAFLIQINNPNAIASIVYVDDRMRGVR